MEDTRRNTSQTTVSLSQTLELGGKRGARVDVATYGQTAAQLELDRRVNGLRADVVQAFYAALRAQTGLDLAKQSLELTERGLRIVDGRVRAGKSSPVEATRAQVQLAEAKLQVRRAETEKTTAYQQFVSALKRCRECLNGYDYSAFSDCSTVIDAGQINSSTRFAMGSKYISTTGKDLISPFLFRATITDISFSISTFSSITDTPESNFVKSFLLLTTVTPCPSYPPFVNFCTKGKLISTWSR